ncbi:19589_t:CDS:2 [Gigaspora rosea]|nr:19589_t:CDS:2 [Gigaspora rosea]
MARKRTRPETLSHIQRNERYRTLDREETPDDRRKRIARKINVARKYYEDLANSSQNSNEITNNQTEASQYELNIIPVQTQSVQRRPRKAHNLARSIIDNFNPIIINRKNVISGRHMLQRMLICCEHCQAIRWPTESPTNCCRGGKVVLAPLGSAPVSILRLLTENSLITGKPYLKQIRLFNSVFAFTSMGASIDPHLADGTNGIYTYRVQGAIYHRIGPLLPAENCIPKFPQIYIYDSNFETELSYRHNVAGQFVYEGQPVVLKILGGQGNNVWRYNRPTANEVAVLMIDGSTTNSTLTRPTISFFNTQSNLNEIISVAKHTKLTRFFEECRNNPEAAGLLYSEFPKFFHWKKDPGNIEKEGETK